MLDLVKKTKHKGMDGKEGRKIRSNIKEASKYSETIEVENIFFYMYSITVVKH